MSNELQTDRYSQMIRRAGAMIGPGGRVVEALTELFPVIEMESAPPEILALGGWRVAWGASERPPNVATTTRHQLFNPAGSGVIASVTQVVLRVTASGFIAGGVEDTQIGGTPVRGLFRDGRFGGARETTLTTEHVDAGSAASGFRVRLDANEHEAFRDDNGLVVLPPGFGFTLASDVVNQRLSVCWFWRERSAERSELNF